MQLGQEIHYESQDELIAVLTEAYKKGQDKGGLQQIKNAVDPFLADISEEDRRIVGLELWKRRTVWISQNPDNLARNPYTGIANYVLPPVGAA